VFFSANPSSPLPVAPCCPRKDSDRSAALHATEVAELVVVVALELDVDGVLDVVVVAGVVTVVEACVIVVVLPDPPQPPTASPRTIAPPARILMTFISGKAHAHPSSKGVPVSQLAAMKPRITTHASRRLESLSPHEIKQLLEKHDPFWLPQLVVASAIVLDLALPDRITIGPTWLLPSLEALLLLGLVAWAPRAGVRNPQVRRQVAIALIALVSFTNVVSLVLLCHYLLKGGKTNGHPLILGGIVLWVTNVLLFGLWYWQLDRGGPIERALSTDRFPDFLFPQMQEKRYAPPDWMPSLVDYLYVSFTNATAFSPTDTMPLTQNAKWLMSIQALTALLTIGLVLARAVNILS
jgi:hypothetical protein